MRITAIDQDQLVKQFMDFVQQEAISVADLVKLSEWIAAVVVESGR